MVEIQACKVWTWKEIQLVKPKVIVTLGGVATRTLLGVPANRTLGSMVGNTYNVDYMDSVILPNWHPSFIMQRSRDKMNDCIDYFRKAKELAK